jgi:hypothetical protein
MPTRLSGRVCGGFGGEAGGLVKAAREWLRLQVGQSVVPAGCACGPKASSTCFAAAMHALSIIG